MIALGEVGQRWPYTILQVAFLKTHESASLDNKVPFIIFGVFFLNLCGKLALHFSNLSLQCEGLKAFPLEKSKQGFSGNIWISASGVKRRPQNIVTLVIKLQDAVIHLGYFFILQSLQRWGRMAKAGTETHTATSLFVHVLHTNNSMLQGCQSWWAKIHTHTKNLNLNSRECERRIKPLPLHNFWAHVYTRNGQNRKGNKVESAHNLVMGFTDEEKFPYSHLSSWPRMQKWPRPVCRNSPFWALQSQVRECWGLHVKEANQLGSTAP